MNVKALVKDPQTAIVNTWGSEKACPSSNRIIDLAAQLADLKRSIKRIKHNKGGISRQFKDAKDNPQECRQLKKEMADISTRLAELEQQRKTLEKQLLEHFEVAENPPAPDFPERFRVSCVPQGEAQALTITVVDDNDTKAWDAYVTAHVRSSPYHLYAWRRVVECAFGHRCHYYAAKNRNGDIVGVLPLVSLKSRLFGNYAVSLPFFNYGGPVADDEYIAEALISTANSHAAQEGWDHLEYRTCEEGRNLPCVSRKVSMILKLPESAERLDESLGAKVRSQFKQASHYKPEISFGGLELLDDYYQVFSRNMRDLGTPVYSKDFFSAMLTELPNNTTLVCVKMGQTAVGAAFLVGYKDMLEIPWASTLRKYNDFNVNMWMYRQILQYAIEHGHGFFDFGRSTIGAGTYNFKKQWGAKPLSHHWYYYLRNTEDLAKNEEPTKPALPQINPDNPKYRIAIAAWKKLPLALANTLGPRIVKNLP